MAFDNPHMRPDEEDADFCRRMDWIAGTFLVGDEGYGNRTIMITAIGIKGLLAVSDHDFCSEGSWTLSCRNWSRVAGWPVYHGA